MALFAGLRYPEKLAGVMCLSGYLLLSKTLTVESSEANRAVPIFQAHGTADPMVSHDLGRGSYDALVKAGYRVDWHEYPMAHQLCLEEVRDIGDWLTHTLVTQPTSA